MSRNQRRNRRNRSGASQAANRNADPGTAEDRSLGVVPYRSSTETKSSLRTTELIAYAGAVLAVIMTALAVDADGEGGDDPFGAESAIRYITYLTIGYLIARGLAKSGSHEHRTARATPPSDDDAPRAHAALDEGTVADDADGDQRDAGTDGDTETVDTVEASGVRPDEMQPAGTARSDARP